MAMTEETLKRIADTTDVTIRNGRQADLFATLLAALGAIISVIAALWFFLGFVENDTRFEHLTSAFVLTLLLFSFAVGPFAIVAGFGRRAYLKGATRSHLFWTLLLMLPWTALGIIAMTHTPLPIWCGLLITILAVLLSLWAFISLILDWRAPHNTDTDNTKLSQENDVLNTPE